MASRSFNYITSGAGVGAATFVSGSVFLPIINLNSTLTSKLDGALVGGLGGTFVNAASRPSRDADIYVPSPSKGSYSSNCIN